MRVQRLRELESEFFTKGLVHSENGAKKLQSIGASLGDSASIKESNKKLRKMGMAADDEDPEIYIADVVAGNGLKDAMQVLGLHRPLRIAVRRLVSISSSKNATGFNLCYCVTAGLRRPSHSDQWRTQVEETGDL